MKKNLNSNIILKPCPFCGGAAYVALTLGSLHIACNHDGSCGPRPSTWFDSDKSIYTQIKIWNQRVENKKEE